MDTHLRHVDDVPRRPMGYGDEIKPEWFKGATEAQLGKRVGLTQFGVNRVVLPPGTYSSVRHWHEAEDEFVYVLLGELLLIDDNGEHPLRPGSFAGFPAGHPNAHHLANKSAEPAVFLVVGTRRVGWEHIHCPDDEQMNRGPWYRATRDAPPDPPDP